MLGTEEGVFCVELDREIIVKIGSETKRIDNVYYVPEEQLLIVISGLYSNHFLCLTFMYMAGSYSLDSSAFVYLLNSFFKRQLCQEKKEASS